MCLAATRLDGAAREMTERAVQASAHPQWKRDNTGCHGVGFAQNLHLHLIVRIDISIDSSGEL